MKGATNMIKIIPCGKRGNKNLYELHDNRPGGSRLFLTTKEISKSIPLVLQRKIVDIEQNYYGGL